jgi:lipoprotein-anchoring transpeptidase ErfK/SrfK
MMVGTVISKNTLKLATILAVMPFGASFALAAQIEPDAIANATFETWQQRQSGDAPVLELDPKSGDVEAAEPESGDKPDAAKVAVPGQPDAVVETPEQSTDVPDEAAAQVSADPEAEKQLEEAEEKAEDESADKEQAEADPFLIRVQVLLDRAYASPGEIDGMLGNNTRKALSAYRAMKGMPANDEIDAEVWASLAKDTQSPIQTYELTGEDIKGPFVPDLSDDYAELAKLDQISYRNITEMLAERFHMDEGLLKALNPDADFEKAGTKITVVATGGAPEAEVDRIVIDKGKGEMRAYGKGEAPVFVAPASIGSNDTPSPSGKVEVVTVVRDPTYTYNPDVNFQQGENKEKMELPAGPNGPVGNVWIDLSKPTYGIHGTPSPNLVNKSGSHGCVRLTNWDAGRLAELVKPKKTKVEFVD